MFSEEILKNMAAVWNTYRV